MTATDLSWRSVAAAWCNSRCCTVPVHVRRGNLFEPVRGQRFDLVLANPPYVPTISAQLPRHRAARSWDAGTTGRSLLDRICDGVEQILTETGTVLVTHSALCDAQQTLRRLKEQRLDARVLVTAIEPFGPVMHERAAMLERQRLIRPGQRHEELVVIGAWRGGGQHSETDA